MMAAPEDNGEKRAGRGIRIEDLPPPGVTRWVIRRKAQVVGAVRTGALCLEEACRRYSLTVEEFQSWQTSIERYGLHGLRSTRLQIYRSTETAGRGAGKTSR